MIKNKYILDERGQPRLESNRNVWAQWMEKAQLHIAESVVGEENFRSHVSTVFLGENYGFSPDGQPLVWETRVFGGPLAGYYSRNSGNRQDAEAQHQQIIAQLKLAIEEQTERRSRLRPQMDDARPA